MVTKKKAAKTDAWPLVNKGTHLTVYTYEDGSTKLEWDDEQLLKEVRAAIATVEKKVKPAVKAKANKTVPKKAPVKTTKAKTKTK